MKAGIVFTSYVPTSLVGVDSPSPTLAAEVVTGLPISTGAFPGNVFFLTEQQANELSASSVNGAPIIQCHAGWYEVVQVDSGADSTYLQQGYIVAQVSIAKGPYVLTDPANATFLGANPAVLLGPVTPGNYTIVQVAGNTNVYIKTGQTGAKGTLVTYATADNGEASLPTGSTGLTNDLYSGIVGQIEEAVSSPALNLVNVSFPFGVI
jgi:hypothetical protein